MLGLSNGSPAFPRKAGFPRVIGRYGMRVACWRSRARTMRQAATAQHVRYFQRRGTGSHVSRTLRGTGTANHGLNRDRDRKRVVEGKSVSVRVDIGGSSIHNKKK